MGTWVARPSDRELVSRAVLHFAVYHTFLLHRHTSGCSAEVARQALPQFAREAVRYHAASRRLLAAWQPTIVQGSQTGQHPLDAEADEAIAEDVLDT